MADSDRVPKQTPPSSPWAMNLGRVSGIPIRLHITFFLLLAWIGFASSAGPGPFRWIGVLYVVSIFACVVLHELGHGLVAQRYGIGVSEIVLYPFGGVARMEKLPRPAQELWIALAGPAVNVVIALALYIGLRATGSLVPWANLRMGSGHWWQELLRANLLLAVFNMIPALPMDGGRVLRALLAMRLGEGRASQMAASLAQLLAFLMGFVGLIQPNLILLFIAFMVFVGAGQEAAVYRSREILEGLPVSAAMITDFRTLPVGATLRDAADLLLQTSQHDFPILHGEGIVGLLSRQSLMRGYAEQGPGSYVAGAMDREFMSVPPEASLEETASQMQGQQESAVLVLDAGRLVGMLTMENLAEFLVIRQLTHRTA